MREEEVIVGVDIGTTKICVIVSKVVDGKINIVGIGSHPSTGMRKGVVVNIDTTVSAIKKAVNEAELMAGLRISRCVASLGGAHLKSFNSNGVVAIREKEVRENDVVRAIEAASAIPIPQDRKIIHVIPQEFIIDDQDGIKDPIGIQGVRLEVKVHIITASSSATQNVLKCLKLAGLEVDGLIVGHLASSEATLSSEEKEIGVVLIDIGGGTSDIAIFSNGSLRFTSVLPVGGSNITGDIAIGLRTPVEEAEKIKKRYGCAFSGMVGTNETIEVPSVGGRKPRVLMRKTLSDIIEPRVEEIGRMLYEEIRKSSLERLLASGAVITGGTANLEGITELFENVFGNMPVRRGYPQGMGGLIDVINDPAYSTAVGLVLYSYSQMKEKGLRKRDGLRYLFERGGLIRRLVKWFKETF